jgi:hypothetical protein
LIPATMTPDPNPGGAALRVYQSYRYTIVTIVNGAQPHTAEAKLWWQRVNDAQRKWQYARRHVAATGVEAARKVEADFKEWVAGRHEAEGG